MVGQNEKGTWGSLKWIAIARAGKSEREDIFNFVIICSLLSGKAHNRFHIGCCSEGQNPKVGHFGPKRVKPRTFKTDKMEKHLKLANIDCCFVARHAQLRRCKQRAPEMCKRCGRGFYIFTDISDIYINILLFLPFSRSQSSLRGSRQDLRGSRQSLKGSRQDLSGSSRFALDHIVHSLQFAVCP